MADPRYKLPAQMRKFGGEIYRFLILGTKAEVEQDKARILSKGTYSVRIVKAGRKYAVYTRKG